MSTLSLWGVESISRPSASKVGVDRLMRVDGWTTNGYWVIKSEFEPKFLAKLRENTDKPQVERILKNVVNAKTEMEIQNHLVYANDLCIKLEGKDFTSWVNIHYLGLFAKSQAYSFWQEQPLTPIFVKNREKEVIGLIMPIRVEL